MTPWSITFTDANGANPQTVQLPAFGAFDSGKSVRNGIKFSFKSHAASECNLQIDGANPSSAPKIPFKSKITLTDGNNVTQFVGRRVDWDGSAEANSQSFSYQFQDAWWELSKIVYKNVWWAGAYQAATLSGNVLTFANAQLGTNQQAEQVAMHNAAGANIGISNLTWSSTTQATIATLPSGTVASASLLFQTTDVVLFQYFPTDPYQTAAQVINYYITTGDQIREILNFAIANGANLQGGQIDPALYVPWYPTRCCNCAEAIKLCLRMHPDAFTEIDYTTTPPTFNVRLRGSLTAKTLPYSFTDSTGNQHVATNIKPRPDLVPSRIAIFYRYLINGSLVAWPQDIYPVGAPDGLLSTDYSLDLQGPTISQQTGQIVSYVFDPTNSTNGMNWWKKKCHALSGASNLVMVDSLGNVGTGELTVLDDNGNAINTSTYAWEFTGGAVMSFLGISVVFANVTSYFSYQTFDANGVLKSAAAIHKQTTRVKLVNTPSIIETFTQFLTTGEAIPSGLAQSIYNALATLQYNLSHKIQARPFVSFIKPGKHLVNLTGGATAWQTMNATVQTTEYSLFSDGNNNVTAIADIRCGPVEHLEAGQLVQLFNLFFNRDVAKINPWERITGTSNTGGGGQPFTDTAQENSHPDTVQPALTQHIAQTPDTNGNRTVLQHDGRTSGIKLFKWDGVTKNTDGTPAPKSNQPYVDIDLNDISTINNAETQTPVTGYSTSDLWNFKIREYPFCLDDGTLGYVQLLGNAVYKKS